MAENARVRRLSDSELIREGLLRQAIREALCILGERRWDSAARAATVLYDVTARVDYPNELAQLALTTKP